MQLPRRFFGWVLLSVLLISALAVACGDQPTPTATTAAPSSMSGLTATVAPEPESTATTVPEAMGATPSPTKIPDATALSPTPTAAPAAMEPTTSPTPAEVRERPNPEDVLTIALNELDGSGQSGWATLAARDGGIEVVLSLGEGTLKSEKVHIHSGQCGADLGGVVHGLTDFTEGNSVTTLEGVSLKSLMTGSFAVNAHKAGDPKVYTACGNIPPAAETLTIALNELDGSGQSGWATLTARDGGIEVVLSLGEGTLKSEKVHIHSGQCGADLGGVVHGLTDFTDGNSVTTLEGVSLKSLMTGSFAVNAHKAGDPKVYTACGNIPGAETMAKSPIKEATMVTLRNFQIVPTVLEVQAGEQARFSVRSTGAGHTFTIPAFGVNVRLPAGITRIVEFEVPDGTSGDIQLLCRFHSSGSGGMVGKLRVNNGGGAY